MFSEHNFSNDLSKLPQDEEAAVRVIPMLEQLTALQPLEDEIEKSPELIGMIDRIREVISADMQKLGLEKDLSLDPRQIHLIPRQKCAELFPENAQDGCYEFATNFAIYMGTGDNSSVIYDYNILIHEIVHLASFTSSFYSTDRKSVHPYRHGFHNHNRFDEADFHDHFEGLNEAVVEKYTQEIIQNKYVTEQLSPTYKTLIGSRYDEFTGDKFLSGYDKYVQMLNIIIRKISANKEVTIADTWGKFKKSLFTGQMYEVLSDVSAVYGKASLRLLADLGSNGEPVDEKNEKIIIDYFSGR
jgi:hypothetical protein